MPKPLAQGYESLSTNRPVLADMLPSKPLQTFVLLANFTELWSQLFIPVKNPFESSLDTPKCCFVRESNSQGRQKLSFYGFPRPAL